MATNTFANKILVLGDLKESTESILKSSIHLAQMTEGEVNFFHVQRPTDVIKSDNQMAAIQSIGKNYNDTDKNIMALTKKLSESTGVSIRSQFVFGNVKDEIQRHIQEYNPDIIVVGKRKAKFLSILGDQITDHVLKIHDGPVLIIDQNNGIISDQTLAIGTLNDLNNALDSQIGHSLLNNMSKPLVSIKIAADVTGTVEQRTTPNTRKTVEYVFQKNDNTLSSLSSYLQKNKINLFCMDRDNSTNQNVVNPKLNDLINKLNVSLLITKTRKVA